MLKSAHKTLCFFAVISILFAGVLFAEEKQPYEDKEISPPRDENGIVTGDNSRLLVSEGRKMYQVGNNVMRPEDDDKYMNRRIETVEKRMDELEKKLAEISEKISKLKS